MFETTIEQLEEMQLFRQERIRSLIYDQEVCTKQLARISKEMVALGEQVWETKEAIKTLKENDNGR